jgi:succinoglycan biosynthesis transport protein ExoP
VESLPVQLATASGTFDIRSYLLTLSRRRWVVIGTLLLVFGAVALYTLRERKVYEATTSLIIDTSQPQFLDGQVKEVLETGSGAYWSSREYAETQQKVILSRAVATRVVEKLGLQQDASFLGLARLPDDPSARSALLVTFDAAEILQNRIAVTPIRDSRLVKIIVQDGSPQRAALLANEIAAAYLEENLALKLRTTESAARWLEDRKDELDARSKSSELAVYDFQKKQDMLTATDKDRANMVSQRLTTFNAALTEVRTRIASLRARSDAIKKLRNGSAVDQEGLWAGVLGGPGGQLIEQLRLRYILDKAECASLTERYLPDHPKAATCNDRLASTRQDLSKAIANIAQSADEELYEAQLKERNLASLLDDAKAEAFEVNRKQIEFDQLRREADNDQRLFDLVQKRLKDIELSGLLRTSNARVLDPARPQMVPIRPKVTRSLFYGLAFGLFAGIALALLLDQLDTSVRTQGDVEQRLGVPFLGFLPRIPSEGEKLLVDRDLYVLHHPKSSVAEACRALRTNLLFMTPDRPFQTMLVTSSAPKEGKTTTVISLGIAMAQSGNRVLIIDTDMRRPRIHRSFGVASEIGLSSVVVGETELAEAIKSTEVPNLFVLPCGPIPPNPAEMFHTKAFAAVLEAARQAYDRVVLDSPPVNAVADAVVLSTQVDGVTLVFKAGATNRSYAQRAIRALLDVNARIFGAAMNDIDSNDPRYGEYYQHYRRYSHNYGYGESPDGRPA